MSKRGVVRAAVALAMVLAVLGGSASPGFADHGGPQHVVCAYTYYEYPPGSEPEYLFDECRIGFTPLGPLVEDGGCEPHTVESFSILICHRYQVYVP